jgi:type I restriction enzyme S subunit
MTSKWPTVKLGEVLTYFTEYIEAPEPREYPKLSVKLYGKGVVLDTPTNGVFLKMKRHQIAKSGQVILSEIWGKKGAIGFVPAEGEGALCTSHFFLFDVRKDKLDARWLQSIFTANYLEAQLGADAKGTTGYAAVRPKTLLACEIPLPPLPEQQRIVTQIEELAAQINEARTLRQQSAEQANAVLTAARRGFFGESPAADWVPLSDYVLAIENGKSPATDGRRASSDEWGVLKVGAVSFGTFDDRENKALPVTFIAPTSLEVREGDFIMSRANTRELVGACALVRKTRPKLMLSDKTFRFVFREPRKILPEYLEHVLKSSALRDQIERGASGTSPTMKNISKEKVLALRLPSTPLPEQKRIIAELQMLQSETDALTHLQAETAAELDALLPAILDRAFKGKL